MTTRQPVPVDRNVARERLNGLLILGAVLLLVAILVAASDYDNWVVVTIGILLATAGQLIALVGVVGYGVKFGIQAARFENREER